MKTKRCKACQLPYIPTRPLQVACGYACALTLAVAKRDKLARVELKAGREKAKTLRDWIKDAQVVFNKFIRLRDNELPCISCQRHHQGQYHAGHYRTTAAAPELRFNEYNVNKQCSVCNNHMSGNILEYRINLIKKYGQQVVDSLEGNHSPAKYTIDDCKAIIATYKAKCKGIQ